jgi:TM2 domain-containing membrane protein YozV
MGSIDLPMSVLDKFFTHHKERRVAVVLALLGTVTPLAGLQKFYLGQPLWGIIYLLLWSTPIPRIACAIDAVWYLIQDLEQFEWQFNGYFKGSPTAQVSSIASALRELDRLRDDGLMSEYEFEQKRRQLIDRMV